jgi:dTDP-4-amino-4,6-dideoxygalactose transaminase
MKNKIKMSSPLITEEDKKAVQEVLNTRFLSNGPKTEEFEKKLASYVGTNHGISVNSGTSALHLAVITAGVEDGDFVITTPFSFVASANCMLFERAVPIFVDIDPITYNIDPEQVALAASDLVRGEEGAEKWLPKKLAKKYRQGGKLKGILPVDIFGQPADYDPLIKIADQYNLKVIEDSCEAFGAEYKNQKAGTLGDVGAFAFYPNKQMTTGEGGILVTDNDDWADMFRSLRNQGRDVFDGWLNHTRLGFNYRLDEMSAALGLSQLNRIEDLLKKRAQVAAMYTERLEKIAGLKTPVVVSTTTKMSWFVYVVRITSEIGRDQVIEELESMGIPSRQYFTPIHLQPFYQERFGYQRGDFPETESAGDQCLALPFSAVMSEEEVGYVCNAVRKIMLS